MRLKQHNGQSVHSIMCDRRTLLQFLAPFSVLFCDIIRHVSLLQTKQKQKRHEYPQHYLVLLTYFIITFVAHVLLGASLHFFKGHMNGPYLCRAERRAVGKVVAGGKLFYLNNSNSHTGVNCSTSLSSWTGFCICFIAFQSTFNSIWVVAFTPIIACHNIICTN